MIAEMHAVLRVKGEKYIEWFISVIISVHGGIKSVFFARIPSIRKYPSEEEHRLGDFRMNDATSLHGL